MQTKILHQNCLITELLRWKYISICSLFVLILLPNFGKAQLNNQDDYTALRALYLATEGHNWDNNSNWPDGAFFLSNPNIPANIDMEDWYGITGDGTRVTEIDFGQFGNGLVGQIPSFLGQLSELKTLRIIGNLLNGPLPHEIGNLTNLEHLDLSYNILSGIIPESYSNLSNLIYLDLGYNNLTGELPAEFSNLQRLESLFLWGNGFTGSIPFQWQELTNLTEVGLSDNNLSGCYPSQLKEQGSVWCNLSIHSISSGNNFNATWDQFCNFSSGSCGYPDHPALIELYVLTGGSSAWTNHTNWPHGNPCDWYGITCNSEDRVIEINLINNGLTGSLQPSIGNLTELQNLTIFSNNLTGTIPTEIGNLSNLESLILSGNQLSGDIPQSIGNLSNLEYLSLSNNQLTGSIPGSFGNLTNLSTSYGLGLNNNNLSGCYDPELKEGNSILCNFSNAQISDGNNFDADWGVFCATNIGACSCEHPDYETLVSLYTFTNGENWTNNDGWLEDCEPCNWNGVICDGNGRVSILTLTNNNLTGQLPQDIGDLSELTEIYFNNNSIGGEIPASLGSLSNLTSLYLRQNNFNGNIPAELGDLTSLTELDLRQNNLEGSIPVSFANLSNLTHFDVSNNQMSGCYDAMLKDDSSVLYNFSNTDVSDGNSFDADWEDFCQIDLGVCSVDSDNDGVNDDEDCAPNDPNAWQEVTLYSDLDGDGFDSGMSLNCIGTAIPAGYSLTTLGDDCDDTDASINPTATEICDGIDNNCDGNVDEGLSLTTWYADTDNDGFGDVNDFQDACTQPNGYVANSDDCDDTDASINPTATEICDGIDNNCDGNVDEGVSVTTWYADTDNDGFGDANDSQDACIQPNGYVANSDDCDDTNASINPNVVEIANDGIDQDCDGVDLIVTPQCNEPTGVVITRIAENQAEFTSADDTNAHYQGTANLHGRPLRPRPMYGMNDIMVGHTQEVISVFEYDIWFRTICENGMYSNWTGPFYLPLFSTNRLTISPNPTQGDIKIGNVEIPIKSVEIFDVSGMFLMEFEIDSSNMFNISKLPSGRYNLKITDIEGDVTLKKVIKR